MFRKFPGKKEGCQHFQSFQNVKKSKIISFQQLNMVGFSGKNLLTISFFFAKAGSKKPLTRLSLYSALLIPEFDNVEQCLSKSTSESPKFFSAFVKAMLDRFPNCLEKN